MEEPSGWECLWVGGWHLTLGCVAAVVVFGVCVGLVCVVCWFGLVLAWCWGLALPVLCWCCVGLFGLGVGVDCVFGVGVVWLLFGLCFVCWLVWVWLLSGVGWFGLALVWLCVFQVWQPMHATL